MISRILKVLFIITVIYFISITAAGFGLFWWLWLQAYLTPEKALNTIIYVNLHGEANIEMVMFIGWVLSLVVIVWMSIGYLKGKEPEKEEVYNPYKSAFNVIENEEY
jgi:hypothetical protein